VKSVDGDVIWWRRQSAVKLVGGEDSRR
jgi:hypothetical protein